MFKTIVATTFALALPATFVLAAPSKDCLLSKVAYVQPQTAQVQQGHAVQQRLVGATLFIPAQAGLTTDWLKRQVDEHQARMAHGQMMKDCVFGVANSHVDVSSNGSGYLMVGS
jgi:anti-sigma factor RsiW